MDLDFDQADTEIGLAPSRLPLSASSRRSSVHDSRNELQFFRLSLRFSYLPAPAKQMLR